MRTILLTLMLLFAFAACAQAQDDPAQEAAAEGGPAEGNEAKDEELVGPVGNIRLKDGSAIEITKLKKIGKYFIYISGKLNGKTSTIISFTRMRDIKRWESITFKDQYNFIISTKEGKKHRFLNSFVFLGSDSHDTYSFYGTNENSLETKLIEVKKSDVALIVIN